MQSLQLQKIELREIEVPLKHAFETSFGVTTKRRLMLVRVFDKCGESGFGECTAMELPFYNPETVDTAWTMLKRCIGPMISAGDVSNAVRLSDVVKPIHGNRMAIAAIETAVWDLEAKCLGVPLWKHLGGALDVIDCGVSIGLQASPDELVERVSGELEAGYKRIKVKIKPDRDVAFVEAVRREFPDILLSADANSAYDLSTHIHVLRKLDDYGLLMIEQPLAAGDLLDHAKLQQLIKTPICLDESITSLRDAKQAIEIDACRIINIKLGRVGGHRAAREIQEFAKSKGIPVWCGGMLETGIGRAHNIAMSTLDGFSLPGDVSASARYWETDIIEPPVTVAANGTIDVPSTPGIGFAIKEKEIERLTTTAESLAL